MHAAPNEPANKKAGIVRTMKKLDNSYDSKVPTHAQDGTCNDGPRGHERHIISFTPGKKSRKSILRFHSVQKSFNFFGNNILAFPGASFYDTCSWCDRPELSCFNS